jgi:hypothetical protein
MDPPLCSRKKTTECGMSTSNITSQKEVQNSTVSRKINIDTFLGMHKGQFFNATKKGTQH